MFGCFKEKHERDIRMQLGITGDTDEGWRQRFRVKKEQAPVVPNVQGSENKEVIVIDVDK